MTHGLPHAPLEALDPVPPLSDLSLFGEETSRA